jgi:Zn-dependent M28 family amino/carboxypeptidase
MALPLTVSGQIRNAIRESTSHNVLGLLPGTDLADEYIIYMAHWDHLGRDDSLEGDKIFNGAVDNATGTAALMEIAEAFTGSATPPRRSVLFMAVTAEESGLLGSRYYGTNPVYPLASTVAGINMDGLNVHGRTRDVAVVGFGSSELEQYLSRAAKQQGRVLVPEPTPEKGFFYRSDHFNLAKQGVPVIYAESGFDYREGGAMRGGELARDWTANRYHKPGDEYSSDWDLSGAVEDMQLYFMIGKELAAGDDWPKWYDGNEFKATREASRDAE